MAEQIYLHKNYLVPRLGFWILLLAVALFDSLRHRLVRSRGWQLNRAVLVVIVSYVFQDAVLLAYAVGTSDRVFLAYIFFTDLADSLFIGLLMVIAAGFCITRDTLGPYKNKVLIIPSVYLVTSLVVDYIMNNINGRAAFDTTSEAYRPEDDLDDISEFQRMLLLFGVVANLVALLLALVYVFDTVQRERDALEAPIRDIYEAREPDGHPLPPAAAAVAPHAQQADAGEGHVVELPTNAIMEEGQNASHLAVTGEDDGPKTVQESMAHRSKVRLMRQFSWGVAAYVIAKAAVLLLPVFVQAQPDETAVRVVTIVKNIVLWGFMASLCWIFRLREDNPYLMLDEDGGMEGGMRGQDISTELGVLNDDDDGPSAKRGLPDLDEPHADSPVSINHNYSLGDDEDEELGGAGAHAADRGADGQAGSGPSMANGQGAVRRENGDVKLPVV